ncbi:MAG: hypothetical protein JWR10_2839 [Rubritepida sp.]|nr:hypothetical protein [Rubritepida sp.]
MSRLVLLASLLSALSLGSGAANAQRLRDQGAPALAGRPSGQDLNRLGTTMPPLNHPAQGFMAERLARAQRQAQFNRNYTGTPLRPLAERPRSPAEGRGDGTL